MGACSGRVSDATAQGHRGRGLGERAEASGSGSLDRTRPGLLRRLLRQGLERRQTPVAATDEAADAATAKLAGRGALELGLRERVVVVRNEALGALAPLALLVKVELLVVAAVNCRFAQLLLLLRNGSGAVRWLRAC